MKGYKGFDKNMKCRSMQYEFGKKFTHNGTVSLCKQGLHFCEHPLDTWNYYKPLDGSHYAEVEADDVSDKAEGDSKRAASSLTVKSEVKIPALLKAAVEFVFSKVKPSAGDSAHSATTGISAHSATTGDSAHSATTGNYAESSVSGKNAIAASLGIKGKAKAAKGDWIVLAEYDKDEKIIAMSVAQVRGKLKADTFYSLKGGKFTEVKA